MKIFRIDLECGEYYTLTEEELQEEFTQEEINDIEKSENDMIFEIPYTLRQLKQARKWKQNDDWCYKFEQKYNIYPSVYDILKIKY